MPPTTSTSSHSDKKYPLPSKSTSSSSHSKH
jgi:hypothetical protein